MDLHTLEKIRAEVLAKKKRYHLQWEGIDNYDESERRKKYNDEVSMYINSVLADLLTYLDTEIAKISVVPEAEHDLGGEEHEFHPGTP